ncbi:MAG TPA: hypothetical protein VLY63_10395 [Anaerolineae bacterium]|nr:hypothetical protein [Anaerolineae bacterium]
MQFGRDAGAGRGGVDTPLFRETIIDPSPRQMDNASIRSGCDADAGQVDAHKSFLPNKMNMGSTSIILQNRRIIESFMVESVPVRGILILRSFGVSEHSFYPYYITKFSDLCKIMVELREIGGNFMLMCGVHAFAELLLPVMIRGSMLFPLAVADNVSLLRLTSSAIIVEIPKRVLRCCSIQGRP